MNDHNTPEDAAAAAAEADKLERRKVREMLSSFGVRTQGHEEAEAAAAERAEQALDGLEDMTDAIRIDLNLPDAAGAEEPVRREGSTPVAQILQEGAAPAPDTWSRNVLGLGLVRASKEHREIYTDIFFTDEPLILNVPMRAGDQSILIKCRTLTPAEREVAALVVQEVVAAHPLLKPATQMVVNEYTLRASMLMQVLAVGDTVWPGASLLDEQKELKGRLKTLIDEFFKDMPKRRFALVAKAVHTFDVICDILDDGAINGDFSGPAYSA